MEHIGKILEVSPQPTHPRQKPAGNINKGSPVDSQEVAEAQERLARDGYGANPFCQRCHGSGWISLKVPVEDERFGKAYPCSAKGCAQDSWQQYRRGESYLKKIGVDQPACSFEKFKRIKGTEEMYQAFYNLAYGKTDLPFLLGYGGVGNGKTHLCQALAVVLNWRGANVRLYVVADLVSTLKQAIPTFTIDVDMLKLKEMDALILDDLGFEEGKDGGQYKLGTDWEEGKLEEILVARYRKRLITVLVTNGDAKWLPERIFSRFSDPDVSQLVLNSAPDFRRREVVG